MCRLICGYLCYLLLFGWFDCVLGGLLVFYWIWVAGLIVFVRLFLFYVVFCCGWFYCFTFVGNGLIAVCCGRFLWVCGFVGLVGWAWVWVVCFRIGWVGWFGLELLVCGGAGVFVVVAACCLGFVNSVGSLL